MTPLTPMANSMNEIKSEAFSHKLLATLNEGAMALMIAVGHRAGLFDLLAKMPPSTSQTIAGVTGLQERYIREWLEAMVTGQIIDYDCAEQTYYLSPEHAACLTQDDSGRVAAFMRHLPLLGSLEDQIVYSFHCWSVSKPPSEHTATAMASFPTQCLSA